MKPGTPFNRSARRAEIVRPAPRVAAPKMPWHRRLARRSMVAVVSLGLGSICAEAAQLQHVDVMTHASQGDVKRVSEGGARMVRSADGIFVNVEAEQLKPNHAYTMWVVAINAPQNCGNDPCSSADVLQRSDYVESDLGYGDGAIAGKDGKARFAAFQPAGAMPHSWFGRGLTNLAGEIHLVIRDHGPLVEGREAEMLTTFRDGCNDKSVPETLPGTARGNGMPGDYTCANIQAAIFMPLE